MDKIISLEFIYRSKVYYALIRTKEDGENRLHSITIMNGDLERLLYGNHIIVEKDGCFKSALPIVNEQIGELKQSIIKALCNYMQLACDKAGRSQAPRVATVLESKKRS